MFKAYTFFSLMLATIGFFSFLVLSGIKNAGSVQPIPPDALQGKIAFQKQACIECHTVFGHGGYLGGDLTKIYAKAGHTALKEYLVFPPKLAGAKQKHHVRVTEQEADAIIAYLRFLSTINTLDWPLDSNARTDSKKL